MYLETRNNFCSLPTILLSKIVLKLSKTDVDQLSILSTEFWTRIHENKAIWKSLSFLKYDVQNMSAQQLYNSYFNQLTNTYAYGYYVLGASGTLGSFETLTLIKGIKGLRQIDMTDNHIIFVNHANELFIAGKTSVGSSVADNEFVWFLTGNVKSAYILYRGIYILDLDNKLWAIGNVTLKTFMDNGRIKHEKDELLYRQYFIHYARCL